MAGIEAIYRSTIRCINERRWEDLPRYMQPRFVQNGQDFTPASCAAEMKSAGGVKKLTVDAVTVDRESQRLSALVLVRYKLPAEANTSADRNAVSGVKLLPQALEDTYRAYIGCINTQTMEAKLHNFCHPQAVHNGRSLTGEDYRLLVQEAFAAIPDITFAIHTVIADEKTQRVAARLEFTGTPAGVLAGAKPSGNGHGVEFCEHVTYQFEEGKIASMEHRGLGILPCAITVRVAGKKTKINLRCL
ncbi:hypothetical protein AAE478_003974 [Parahypoxylon ruwenzoriense]